MEAVIATEVIVTEELCNRRLDQVLAKTYTQYSRSRLQLWLTHGLIKLDGIVTSKARTKVKQGSIISINPEAINEQGLLQLDQDKNNYVAEHIELNIVYEDQDIIIINKPANLVVHPGAGNLTGTLVNGLLYHYPELEKMPRAGIVHRLDKDTTGLMVVARNLQAHYSLIQQLQAREVTRKYKALVHGHIVAGDTIDTYMARHKTNRLKMTVIEHEYCSFTDSEYNFDTELESPKVAHAKQAVTHYRVLRKYPKHSLLEVKLSTGRTHQIRVHMAHIGYPIVGDKLYGREYATPKEFDDEQVAAWKNFHRQALAAVELGFIHPTSKDYVSWHVDLPQDMQALVDILENTF